MVLSVRKLLVAVIFTLAVILSVIALSRIIDTTPTQEIPTTTNMEIGQAQIKTAGSYFAEHRMIRERNRSRQIELLEKIINNDRMDIQNKSRAARELISLTQNTERERLAEETVKAVGYQDCVVLIREGAALAVIAADNLSKNNEQLIASQLAEILQMKAEKITVMARPMGKTTS